MRFLLSPRLLFFIFLLSFSTALAQPAPPDIKAAGAVLMDAKTGQVLYEKNADKRLAPASTTKIMTAILAIESDRLDEKTTISKNAASVTGSTMHLTEGQIISLRELLTGLMMRSGNDAAIAIAEFLAGSVEEFVREMNEKAVAIGAMHTHFVNPHGLTAPEHYSTAYDLAWIARYAMNNPTFAQIVNTRHTSIDWQDSRGKEHEQNLKNTNKLLWMLEEADGIKTGTTNEAGPCLVSSATRENQRLIAVTLKDKDRWQDSATLLKWGFDTFKLYDYATEDEIIKKIGVNDGIEDVLNIRPSEAAAVVIEANKLSAVTVDTDLPAKMKAPIYEGQKVGELHFKLDGKTIRSIDLVAAQDVEERTLSRIVLNYLTTILKLFSSWGVV